MRAKNEYKLIAEQYQQMHDQKLLEEFLNEGVLVEGKDPGTVGKVWGGLKRLLKIKGKPPAVTNPQPVVTPKMPPKIDVGPPIKPPTGTPKTGSGGGTKPPTGSGGGTKPMGRVEKAGRDAGKYMFDKPIKRIGGGGLGLAGAGAAYQHLKPGENPDGSSPGLIAQFQGMLDKSVRQIGEWIPKVGEFFAKHGIGYLPWAALGVGGGLAALKIWKSSKDKEEDKEEDNEAPEGGIELVEMSEQSLSSADPDDRFPFAQVGQLMTAHGEEVTADGDVMNYLDKFGTWELEDNDVFGPLAVKTSN